MVDQLVLFCPVCYTPADAPICPVRTEVCGLEPNYEEEHV